MRCFTPEGGSFPHKINYVDEANRVVGFDDSTHCCEEHGHGVFYTPAPVSSDHKHERAPEAKISLAAYSFVDEDPTEHPATYNNGGSIAFRIAAPSLPDAWVVLWNYHTGYYSHGFTAWKRSGHL